VAKLGRRASAVQHFERQAQCLLGEPAGAGRGGFVGMRGSPR